MNVVDAPLHERQDARELFEKIAERFKGGNSSFDVAVLASELSWPLERAMVAMNVLERAGLVNKRRHSAES